MNKMTAATIAILLLISGIFTYTKLKKKAPAIKNPAIAVEIKSVQEEAVPLEIHAMGTITAKTVEVTPEQTGHVEKIFFQDGRFVKRGEPLVQLDNAIFKAKLDSAKAQLAYSENNFNRMKLLGKQGAISKQAIDQADADLKEKKAATKESEVVFKKMLLSAPFDGRVGKSKVNVGDYVTVGQSLVAVTDTAHLRIEYTLPETVFSLLKLGQMIHVTTPSQAGKQFTGTISFISPTINVENRSIALYADIQNENNDLTSGMLVNVIQTLGASVKALMIPARSLVVSLDGNQVYKVLNGKAFSVNVVTGKRHKEEVEIVQGLARGDRVITDGQMKVKNGAPVIDRKKV